VNGALRDPVDGGFYRRCIDDEWKEPYHQKTLSDQARIALALFDAADVAKDDKLRAAGIAALDFALKELRNPDGTFAAALDGTLEEDRDPLKRPKFVKVGSATSASLAQFVAALYLSGKENLQFRAVEVIESFPNLDATRRHFVLAHSTESRVAPSAADVLSEVVTGKSTGNGHDGDSAKLKNVNELYFDPVSGMYLASSAKLPMGIAMRAPASGETPSAEVLALLAGVDEKIATLIRRNLLTQIEYDELPPGDILLGLGANR
jgi:uncharacterized protein